MFHVKHMIQDFINLDDLQVEQFDTYLLDLLERNNHVNLTSITDPDMFHVKHYLDSLMLIKAVPDVSRETYKVIDVGTGGGFPGIPLAIAFPNLEVTLIDSLDKRIKFINEEIEKLGIKNAKAFHGRAEDFARGTEYREKFDIAVSRAVANLSTLTEYCLPFVHIGGYFLPYKGAAIAEEISGAERAVNELGGKLESIVEYSLPGDEGERTIIRIKKVKTTPDKYPRKAGKPSKSPL